MGTSKIHHETAVERMVQAGTVPVTARQVVFEWQREAMGAFSSAGSRPQTKKTPKKR